MNNTKKIPAQFRPLLCLLGNGEENALKTCHIMSALKLSRREVVALVSKARAAGIPILSSSFNGGGYYFPDATDKAKALSEIRVCLATISNRAANTFKSIEVLRDEADKIADEMGDYEQLSFDLPQQADGSNPTGSI